MPLPEPVTLEQLGADTLHRLDWPVLLQHIASECETPYGRKAWQQHPFCEAVQAARQHLSEVSALRQVIGSQGWPVTSGAFQQAADLTGAFSRLEKSGVISLAELFALRLFLQLARDWTFALQPAEASVKSLLEPYTSVIGHLPLSVRRQVNQIVTEDGLLSPTASVELGRLLHQQKSMQQAADQQMQGLLQQAELVSQLQSTNVLIREGQLVLAVKAVHKNSFPGQVVSLSATGSTVFMVPDGLVGLNKKLHTVATDIELEIQRILTEFSNSVRDHVSLLQQGLDTLAELDKRLGAARWAKRLSAIAPELLEGESAGLELLQVRHPLLEAPVANTVRLGSLDNMAAKTGANTGDRTMVITGPNTGGKTVLLKTIGLSLLLVKAGVPIPADSGSRLSWFEAVYADIGDEQSLQQNLSTFSGHLTKLRALCEADTQLSKSLVLLDEIAAGTDPTEAAVLAQAVLQTLHDKQALTIATTHLGSLKVFAHQTDGFQNASMLFDVDTLSPTYQLLQGVPGTSHALSIAERLGLNPEVVNRARSLMHSGDRDTASLLEQVATQQAKIQEELHKAQSYRQEAQSAYERLEDQRFKLEQERKQLLHQMKSTLRNQTRDIQEQLKKLRKRLIATETGGQIQRYKVGKLTDQLQRVEDRATTVFTQADRPLAKLPKAKRLPAVEVGQTVFCKKLNLNVQVVAVNGDRVQIQAGLLKSTVTLKDLEVRKAGLPDANKPITGGSKRHVTNTPTASEGVKGNFSSVSSLECDIRGKSAEDALAELSLFLDQALLGGLEQVSIIHGLGTGVLKQAVRQHLRQSRFVKDFYPAPAVEGGDGKTIVKL